MKATQAQAPPRRSIAMRAGKFIMTCLAIGLHAQSWQCLCDACQKRYFLHGWLKEARSICPSSNPKLYNMDSHRRWNPHPVPSSADGAPIKRRILTPYPVNDHGALERLNELSAVWHEASRANQKLAVHQNARNKVEEQLRLSFFAISSTVFQCVECLRYCSQSWPYQNVSASRVL